LPRVFSTAANITALITTSERSAVIGKWYRYEYAVRSGMLAAATMRK
jgi:hypothetical protein